MVCNNSLLRTRKLCEDSFDERAGKVAGAVKTSCARTLPGRNHHSVCASPCVGRGTGSRTEEPSWLVRWQVGVTLLTCQCSVLAGMAIVVIAFIKRA